VSKRTILNIESQNAFLNANRQLLVIEHKWSCRGYGNSKLIDKRGNLLAQAGGCGYDRLGTVIGDMIEALLPGELLTLAKKECKTGTKTRATSKEYYGLFYNKAERRAYVDGGCGKDCMQRILNRIGFELNYLSEKSGSVSGSEFYELRAISKHTRKYL
jgi:hypothetical protein